MGYFGVWNRGGFVLLADATVDARRAARNVGARTSHVGRESRRDVGRPTAATSSTRGILSWAAAAFVIGLSIPWIIPVGSLNFSAYRLILLATLVPCLINWISGRAGSVRIADVAVLVLCAWAAASFVAAHGFSSAVQPAGMFFIETAGAYFLARCTMRSADSFRKMVMLSATVVIVLLPFALYETVTGAKPILSIFGLVFPTVESTSMPRSGLWRAQGPFNHSILFGAYCASLLALVFSIADRGKLGAKSLLYGGLIALTAAMSLSSAPIAAITVQVALILWNVILRRVTFRWKILWLGGLLAYLVIEFGSNQTPIQFYISRFTFDQQTGWYRLWIWEYGSASVLNHPLLGIGLNDWARPAWMHADSVDNFWLLTAMRQGIPAFLLLAAAFLLNTLSVARRHFRDIQLDSYRTGYLICMAALAFVGSTVHFTGPTYAWFMFLLGSGVWLLDVQETGSNVPGAGRRPGSREQSRQAEAQRIRKNRHRGYAASTEAL